MSYKSHKTNESNMNKKGGYENLIVYWLATEIYDLTTIFCSRFVDKRSRTYDQMVQAARSGKQNIVEGSLENSIEGNLKLTGIARASFGELLEDYRDFLRQRGLSVWTKDDSRILIIRKTQNSNKSYESYKTYKSYLKDPESFANLMITLCFKTGYLLDKLLKAQQDIFIRRGGFRENLFKKRLDFKRNTS